MAKTIEFIGSIGVGKTTLAKQLELDCFNLTVVDEEFFNDNPFLKDFFQKDSAVAFETQMTYLLQIYNSRKNIPLAEYVVYDHSIVGNYAYAMLSLDPQEFIVYSVLYNHIFQRIHPADIIVNVRCDLEEQYRRLKKRNRNFEQQISKKYLKSYNECLDKSLDRYLDEFACSVIDIDLTNMDIINNDEDFEMVAETIFNEIMIN